MKHLYCIYVFLLLFSSSLMYSASKPRSLANNTNRALNQDDIALFKDLVSLKDLVSQDKSIIHKRDSYRRTLLFKALYAGDSIDISVINFLLEHGAASVINEGDSLGRTALLLACLHNDSKKIELLLQHGADPSNADITGKSPLYWCCAHKNINMVKMLVEYGVRVTEKDINMHDGNDGNHTKIMLYLACIGDYQARTQKAEGKQFILELMDDKEILSWAGPLVKEISDFLVRLSGIQVLRDIMQGNNPRKSEFFNLFKSKEIDKKALLNGYECDDYIQFLKCFAEKNQYYFRKKINFNANGFIREYLFQKKLYHSTAKEFVGASIQKNKEKITGRSRIAGCDVVVRCVT